MNIYLCSEYRVSPKLINGSSTYVLGVFSSLENAKAMFKLMNQKTEKLWIVNTSAWVAPIRDNEKDGLFYHIRIYQLDVNPEFEYQRWLAQVINPMIELPMTVNSLQLE